MGSIRADFERFAATEAGFRTALGVFEETLSSLEEKLRVNLADWEGEAKEAHRIFVESWHASAKDLAGELARLHRGIEVAHHNFRAAKAASMRMWTL